MKHQDFDVWLRRIWYKNINGTKWKFSIKYLTGWKYWWIVVIVINIYCDLYFIRSITRFFFFLHFGHQTRPCLNCTDLKRMILRILIYGLKSILLYVIRNSCVKHNIFEITSSWKLSNFSRSKRALFFIFSFPLLGSKSKAFEGSLSE